MANKERLDRAYVSCAYAMAELSHAKRKQVGAILVKQGIIGEGYNGTPSGFDNACETSDHPHRFVYSEPAQARICMHDACTAYKTSDSEEVQNEKLSMLVTKPEVLHAESNAIAKVARSNNSTVGATMYVTLCPCVDCSLLIIQTGIVRVVYAEDYRSLDGPNLLRKAGIQVDKING